MLGTTLGNYRIERELGHGGMGVVYMGVHALLGRPAAVKVLLAKYSQDQQIVERFFNEARAATAIKHPGIVEIYDFGYAPDGSAYIVMELCDGESLARRARRRAPIVKSLALVRHIAGALAAAHRAGIIHRDLKPDNVFVVPDPELAGGERIKLLDFGIAKLVTTDRPAKTATGVIMGTPYYMSPEQCRGAGQIDQRSDLYSLGVMLFELLCGRLPFTGEGSGDIIGAHLHLAPPAPSSLAPSVPGDLERLILRLLAKKPDDRPADAEAVIAELDRLAATIAPTLESGGAASTEVSALEPTAPSGDPVDALAPTAATTPPATRKGPPRRAQILVAAGGIAVVGSIAAFVALRSGGAGATAPLDAPPGPVIWDFAGDLVEAIPGSSPPEIYAGAIGSRLDKSAIRAALTPYRNSFGYCYSRAQHMVSGTDVRLTFTVELDGTVTGARTDSKDEAVNACLLDYLHQIAFPRPKDRAVQVTWPLRFMMSASPPPAAGSGR